MILPDEVLIYKANEHLVYCDSISNLCFEVMKG